MAILRKAVVLSFVLGTLAITWYASEMYHSIYGNSDGDGGGGGHGGGHGHPSSSISSSSSSSSETKPSLREAITAAIYAIGSSCWILTCFLAYLGPLLGVVWRWPSMPGKISGVSSLRTNPLARISNSISNSISPRRAILWCLVVAPSLGLFLYGTILGIPASKRILGGNGGSHGHGHRLEDEDEHQHNHTMGLLEWVSVLVMSSAMPAGTAGMVSMGIYVFATVAKHSPLWSAYVVLPNEGNKGASASTSAHANLMRDALRLHQWAGYVTFFWFSLHTVLYCLIYGYRGLAEHFSEAAVAAVTAEATNTTDIEAKDKVEAADVATTGQMAGIFLGAVWNALVPPPECRPILIHMPLKHNIGDDSKREGRSATQSHGRRLFRMLSEEVEENIIDGHNTTNSSSFSPAAITSRSNKTQTNTTIINVNAEPPPQQQQQQKQQHTRSPCYGYYRNFNGFLAILSLLALVLTSLSFVRRANYRFFYISHIVWATVFVLTMIFHMKRIIVYLLPSLVCYVATTIPTLIQGVVGAIWDGGVHLEDYTVLASSSTSKTSNHNEGEGVVELTFLVESTPAEALEAIVTKTKNSSNSNSNIQSMDDGKLYLVENDSGRAQRLFHRPKSVRICVPSISLLWYPFTVIEPITSAATVSAIVATTATAHGEFPKTDTNGDDNSDDDSNHYENDGDNHDQGNIKTTNTNLVECKILLGTVGYFTRTLWKRLRQLQLEENDEEEHEDEEEVFEDEDSLGEGVRNFNRVHNRRNRPALRQPLILVDGFYSGASDWIQNALHHDSILIAAGGTGVTPFLSFLPRLLLQLQLAGNKPSETNRYEDEEDGRCYNASTTTTVSFLWCCRDEALIKHVLNAYLMPLFRIHPEQHDQKQQQLQIGQATGTGGGIRFRLMVYNTSRDHSDTSLLELNPDLNKQNENSKRIAVAAPRGLPMRPSKFQHNPVSSRAKALARAVTFLSIALVGIKVHLWSNEIVHADRFSFSIRAYGLYAIVIWSCLVGIVAEVAWRSWWVWGSLFYIQKGYAAIANHRDESGKGALHMADGDGTTEISANENAFLETKLNARASFVEESSPSRGGLGIPSLAPGRVYSNEEIVEGKETETKIHPILELSISNGRPILEQGGCGEHAEDDGDGGHNDNVNADENVLGPSEATLQHLVRADRPGVFYCGPGGLLGSIKDCVNTGRIERSLRESEIKNEAPIADCTYYEESFEM